MGLEADLSLNVSSPASQHFALSKKLKFFEFLFAQLKYGESTSFSVLFCFFFFPRRFDITYTNWLVHSKCSINATSYFCRRSTSLLGF